MTVTGLCHSIGNIGCTTDICGNGIAKPLVATKDGNNSEITVPLLTIVPIPFIRIDDMTIDFKASITSSKEEEDKTTQSSSKSGSFSASAKYLFFSAKLEGTISSKKDSSSTKNSKYSVETTIDVHIHAVQDELPAGLSRMLDILADTISGEAKGKAKQVK